jgi:hypothetical protein
MKNHSMSALLVGALAVLVSGCSNPHRGAAYGREQESTPHVVLPERTDFDCNPKARKAYLEAYRDGYLAQMSGDSGVICAFGREGIVGTAREIGWMDGQFDASRALHEKKVQKLGAEANGHQPFNSETNETQPAGGLRR